MKSFLNDSIHWLLKRFSKRVSISRSEAEQALNKAKQMQQEIRNWLGNTAYEKIGLGQNCNASWYLKVTGNKRASYVFDWIYTTPAFIIDMLNDDFSKLMDRELIIPHGLDAGHKVYHEMLFGHRNPLRSDRDYQYYERSVARWREQMLSGQPVAFVTVVLNEFEKRRRWRQGFTKQFEMPKDQQLSDFEPMMQRLTAINPHCKFLFIEQYTDRPFQLSVTEKTANVLWLKSCAIGGNTGFRYINDLDDEVMKILFQGLNADI